MAGLLALALVGCGKEVEPADPEGYWASESQQELLPSILEEHGMFTVYQFDENNSFRIISHLPDYGPLTREGTYEINNEEISVSVPAEQVTVAEGTTLSLAALDHVEVKRDGDKLIIGAFPPKDQKVTAVRITEEEYQRKANGDSSASKEGGRS